MLAIARVHGPLLEINIRLFAHNVCVSPTHTLDLGQGVSTMNISKPLRTTAREDSLDFALSVNVGIEQT